MTLTTIPTNVGGLRLYERFGFKTTKTVTSPSYEKHTGIAGRVFLEKELDPAETPSGHSRRGHRVVPTAVAVPTASARHSGE